MNNFQPVILKMFIERKAYAASWEHSHKYMHMQGNSSYRDKKHQGTHAHPENV